MSSESEIDKDEKAEGKTAKTTGVIIDDEEFKRIKRLEKFIFDNVPRDVNIHYGFVRYPPGGGKPYFVSLNQIDKKILGQILVLSLIHISEPTRPY